MKNFTQKTLFVLALSLAVVSGAFAQATTPQTTLSAAITSGATQIRVASTSSSGITPSMNMAAANLGAFQTELWVDAELIGVTSISGTTLTVQRGLEGTNQASHASSAVVWWGPPNYFSLNVTEPGGSCTAANVVALPRFFVFSGNGWACPTAGARNGLWTLQYPRMAEVAPADSGITGTVATGVCHAQYSFAQDGGAVSTITPFKNCTIPINSVIWQGITEVGATTVGSTGNVSVGLSAGGGTTTSLLAATARASLTTGLMFQAPMVQTTASASNTGYIKLSAAAQVTVTVSTNALTAGTLDVYVFYVTPTL